MKSLRRFFARFAGLATRRAQDERLREEIDEHIALQTAENIRAGLSPVEARRRAKLKFGGVEGMKEDYRAKRGLPIIDTLLGDLRYGLRMLAKSPGFTVVSLLTLALGIGANTALFSVINGVLLNPLRYPNPEQLVELAANAPPFSESSIAYPNFLDWVRGSRTFETLAAYRMNDFNLTGSGEAQHVQAMQVSASFFPLLGVKPLIGRNFTPEEDQRGAAPVVMLSYGLWQSKFGGSSDILGKTLILDGKGHTVVGVIPPSFYFCCETTNFRLGDVYAPIGAWNSPELYGRGNHVGTYAVGRMKPGVTIEQAHADMDSVARNLAAAYPETNKKEGVWIAPLKQRMLQDVKPMLLILLAAVGCVLLIGCVNVANLSLARSTGRAREFSIRAALGASQGRVIRQLLTESMLLSVAGGGLGLLLAFWGTQAGLKVLSGALPRANDVRFDPRVLFFTLVVSILVGLLFGLAPALKTSQPDLHAALKEGGRGASGARHGLQRVFVVVEVALAAVLLIGAGLAIRSLSHLWSVNPGFNPTNVLTFTVARPPSNAGETPDEIREGIRQLIDSVAAIPGVRSAALTDGAQPMNGDDECQFWIDGRPKPQTQSEMPSALFYIVSPDYWKVMEIPLLRGRYLTAQDDAHSPHVSLIDENFAQEYFPNQDPIGMRFHVDGADQAYEIVGVVGHVNQWGLANDSSGPVKVQLYTLFQQFPDKWVSSAPYYLNAFVVRTETPNSSGAPAIRSALQQTNSEQVAYDFVPMEDIIAHSLASRRFAMSLLGAFAAIALLLTSIGIYGVVSHVAGQRTHEIGVRLALGAQRSDVLRLVLGQGARLALMGVVAGLVGATGLTRLMTLMLFGVSAVDPLTFASVAILLCGVALAACYVPARRAMRVDPMVALRHE